MIRYIPIQVADDGVHCGECEARDFSYCGSFADTVNFDLLTRDYKRAPQCLAQAKEIPSDNQPRD